MDVREWIYGLCEGQVIGRQSAKNAIQSSVNGNFVTSLSEPFSLMVGDREVELPVDTELVVYRRPTPSRDGSWLAGNDDTMAVAFLKDHNRRTIAQVVIRMNGTIRQKRLV